MKQYKRNGATKFMNTKSAFVAIVGMPNVGKSSLLNRLVGEKVAIVSAKPQTTRTRITGILTQGDTQLVFIDTPGMHSPKTKLGSYMVGQIQDSIADVNLAILVTEPLGEIRRQELEMAQKLRAKRIPTILAVNKIDALDRKEKMLEKIAAFSAQMDFQEVVPISALAGDGVDILLERTLQSAEPGPHYFDDAAFTDQPERVIVAELIREKLLQSLQQEIPHGTAVSVETMKERADRDILDIEAIIYCEKASHKGMIIGKGGAMLKRVASQSRAELESFFGIQVNLQCWVKVKDDWRNREGLIRNFGFQ